VPSRKATQNAAIQLASILADEREGILQTVTHYFAETLAATCQDRVLKRLQKLGLKDGSNITVNLNSLASTAHLSNEDQAISDVHDALKAYYKVALKCFTDSVVIQIVERFYLRSEGPVKSVSAEYIGGLSDTDLAHLAAENYTTSSSRKDVNAKLERLEKPLAIAEKERS
jgi:predicted DNA-binding antitoxin AbrB/MazE fold protein